MVEIVSALPGLANYVEKGGVIAILVLIVAVLATEVRRLRAECKAAGDKHEAALKAVYASRDKYRLGFAICKAECDRANLKPDLSMLADLLEEGAALA